MSENRAKSHSVFPTVTDGRNGSSKIYTSGSTLSMVGSTMQCSVSLLRWFATTDTAPSFSKASSHHLQGPEHIRTQGEGKTYFSLSHYTRITTYQDNANVASSAVKVFGLYWWKAESLHRPGDQNLIVGPAQGRWEFLCHQQPQLPEWPSAQQATQKDNTEGTPK